MVFYCVGLLANGWEDGYTLRAGPVEPGNRWALPNLDFIGLRPAMKRFFSLFAFVALAIVGTSAAKADLVLNTPSGLSAGDHFRFIFATGSTTTATSTDINSYDTFVRNDVSSLYGTVTYGGSAITNWLAVVSTPTVNAKDHLGGYSSSVSVWRPDGTQIASSLDTATGGLWSGATVSFHSVSRYLDGSSTDYTNVWTGSANDGTAGLLPMGSSPNVTVGHTYYGANWLYTNPPGSADALVSYPLFAVSPELVASGTPSAVPEIDPATGASALSLVGGVLAMIEQRRRRRQVPTVAV